MSRRRVKAKPGELKAQWGYTRDEGENIYFAWGEGCHKADGGMLSHVLEGERPILLAGGLKFQQSLRKELEERGYDITTLKFSILKKCLQSAPSSGGEPEVKP